MTPTPDRPKRYLRNFLLEPRFQLKYAVMLMAVSVLICTPAITLVYAKIRESSRLVVMQQIGPDESLNAAVAAALAQSDSATLLALICAFSAVTAAIGAASIFVTHRIVGPVCVVTRALDDIGRGLIPRRQALRLGDEFSSLFNSVKNVCEALEERRRHRLERLDAALQQLEHCAGRLASGGNNEIAAQSIRDVAGDLSKLRDATEQALASALPTSTQETSPSA